jgi:hypothetical protein
MKRERLPAKPASRYASRASCWRSGSVSTVVSTPSRRIPRSRWMPDTPVPVPISTTDFASPAAASSRSAAPVPGETGLRPAVCERARARMRASSSATNASANAQLACRLPVMALSALSPGTLLARSPPVLVRSRPPRPALARRNPRHSRPVRRLYPLGREPADGTGR